MYYILHGNDSNRMKQKLASIKQKHDISQVLVFDCNSSLQSDILAEMDRAVKANKFVVFTADDENPLTFVPENVEAVYLEITDITNKLKIFLEDKSRGSDYGD